MRNRWFVAGLAMVLFTASTPDDGERLARSRCGACHVFPEPALLPKTMWADHVLPHMGYFLGIYPNDSVRHRLWESGQDVYPQEPLIAVADWEKIKTYYLKNAPERLDLPPVLPPAALSLFRPVVPAERFAIPSATLVQFREEGGLLLGDANSRRLAWFDRRLKPEKAGALGEGIVYCRETSTGMDVLVMGQFSPTDSAFGKLIRMDPNSSRAEVLLDGLQRPVHAAFADFNGDGLEDVAICEFGRWKGALNLYFRQKNGDYSKKTLRAAPGATRVYVRDVNSDGLPDLMALFAQGDEGILRYVNLGNGKFREETVLRFPPSWGSSSFRLFDVDADGWEDIVYTCGDNADYPPVLKPYHGLRVFLNKAGKTYVEAFFYPLHGAYDAVPNDYDQDGDVDFAVVSFFPDWQKQPRSGFVYLENTGGFKLSPRTFDGVENGRWMVMDAGDLEGDGDVDLVLGPLCMEAKPDGGEMERWLGFGLPFLVLENVLR